VLTPDTKDSILTLRHDTGAEWSRPKHLNWLQIRDSTTRGHLTSTDEWPAGDGGGANVHGAWNKDFSWVHRGHGDGNDLLVLNDGTYDLLRVAEGSGNISLKESLYVNDFMHVADQLQIGSCELAVQGCRGNPAGANYHAGVDRNPVDLKGPVSLSAVSLDGRIALQLLSTGSGATGSRTEQGTTDSSFEEHIASKLEIRSPHLFEQTVRMNRWEIRHKNTTKSTSHPIEHYSRLTPGHSTSMYVRETPVDTRVLTVEYGDLEVLRMVPSTEFGGYSGDILLAGSLDVGSVFIRKRLLHDESKPLAQPDGANQRSTDYSWYTGSTPSSGAGYNDGPDVLQSDHLNQQFERGDYDDNRMHEQQVGAAHVLGHSFDSNGVITDPLQLNVQGAVMESCSGFEDQSRWEAGNNHCYIKVATPMSISDARAYCTKQHSGYLVTLLSEEENTMVRKMLHTSNITGHFWVGYTDVQRQCEFRWMTGENAFTSQMTKYENWRLGQPNGYVSEDCVVIDSKTGKWDDVSCLAENMFLCEKNF